MSLASALKCLFCLIKCSKYLYFIKKAVCILAVGITVITGICMLSGNKCLTKRLKEML
ncbi:MAG: hypothetical protein IKV21_05180 [Clostridia bacterium]|nr:hypothetical protein [Clostridia bacterium]